MNDSRITVNVALRLSGRMTWRKLHPGAALEPAGSKYSSGIDRMPAMKITVAMPTPFQTSTSATDSSAMLGSVSQPGRRGRRRRGPG